LFPARKGRLCWKSADEIFDIRHMPPPAACCPDAAIVERHRKAMQVTNARCPKRVDDRQDVGGERGGFRLLNLMALACMLRPMTVPSSTLRQRTAWWCHSACSRGSFQVGVRWPSVGDFRADWHDSAGRVRKRLPMQRLESFERPIIPSASPCLMCWLPRGYHPVSGSETLRKNGGAILRRAIDTSPIRHSSAPPRVNFVAVVAMRRTIYRN
jgi:hypothetical protein